MKGLLHRLAARAAGTAPLIRSDARLPFCGGGLAWADETLDGNSTAAREMPPSPIAAPPDAPTEWAEPEPARTSVVTSTNVSIEAFAEAPGAQSLHKAFSSVPPPDATLQASEPAVHRLPGKKPHDVSQPAPGPSVPEAAPRLASALSVVPENREPTAARRGSSGRETSPPLVEPARLMPSAGVHLDTTMPTITRQRSAPPPAPAAQASDDTTEVHIHIGRIEVTAVHEAPAPRAQPSKRQAPMSLDAYLAERSKP